MTKDNPKAKPKRARRIQKAEERTSAQHCPGSYGYVKLQLVSATFVQLRQLPCHFDKIVTSDSNIAYIRDMINEHCGETLNNIIVFEGELLAGDVRQTSESPLSDEVALCDLGFRALPSVEEAQSAEANTLFYDHKVDQDLTALLTDDSYWTHRVLPLNPEL
eukprot:TRINITY_DN7300_c0_g1_i2.p1 TRINITY_DN7300_c0_g1~~TRINITY_DN7300_c0_g1_i2.p1  ORF type:complete len:162 (+),score=29.65 TRINITY_DN7300_c0_g1_i2:119-604(+)